MAIPFIDLCSGIGGFHFGLVNTGHYRCVGHAEIDKNAEKAYNAIYGEDVYKRQSVNCEVKGSHISAALSLAFTPFALHASQSA